MIRILIADDFDLFRRGLRMMLEMEDDFEVVGEAQGGEEAVELADELHPDVVLMDYNMPGLSGIEATRHIVSEHPDLAVLVLTIYKSDDAISKALDAGARGYILKDGAPGEIVAAVRRASEESVSRNGTRPRPQ